MKKILTLLFSLITFALLAQNPVSTRQLRFYPITTSSDTTANNANRGRMWYDAVSQEFRFNKDGTNASIGSGSSGLTTASNGLTATGSNVSLGGTLTGNTSIAQGGFNTNFTGTGKVTFSPSVTLSGINVGSVNGDPSSLSPGDIWYSSLNSSWRIRTAASTTILLSSFSVINNAIPFHSGVTGTTTTDGGFTFSTTGDVLTVGRLVSLSTSTLPGVNVGGFTGDPSTLTNADLWYNSSTNNLRARINGTSYSWLTNSSATNEIPKSNSSGLLVSSGIESTSAGNILLGLSATSGTARSLNVQGSDANISLTLSSKGTGIARLFSEGEVYINVGDQLNSQGFIVDSPTSTTTRIKPIIGTDLIVSSDYTDNDAGNLIVRGGNTSGTGNLNGGNLTLASGTGLNTGLDGDLILETYNEVGTLKLNDGSNEQMGISTLVAGTVTINNTKITANTRIFYSVQTAGGTQGFLSTTRVAGTSFTINSTSATETSTVAWILIEPN